MLLFVVAGVGVGAVVACIVVVYVVAVVGDNVAAVSCCR